MLKHCVLGRWYRWRLKVHHQRLLTQYSCCMLVDVKIKWFEKGLNLKCDILCSLWTTWKANLYGNHWFGRLSCISFVRRFVVWPLFWKTNSSMSCLLEDQALYDNWKTNSCMVSALFFTNLGYQITVLFWLECVF